MEGKSNLCPDLLELSPLFYGSGIITGALRKTCIIKSYSKFSGQKSYLTLWLIYIDGV
jgi:hypothetical protein